MFPDVDIRMITYTIKKRIAKPEIFARICHSHLIEKKLRCSISSRHIKTAEACPNEEKNDQKSKILLHVSTLFLAPL